MAGLSKRILIVDDDQDIQDMFGEILAAEGYEVLRAENGKVALSLLLELKAAKIPNLIILDSQMPEMNGLEFIHAFMDVDSKTIKAIPILFSSGNDAAPDDGIPREIKRIRKPMDIEVLIDMVAKTLN